MSCDLDDELSGCETLLAVVNMVTDSEQNACKNSAI